MHVRNEKLKYVLVGLFGIATIVSFISFSSENLKGALVNLQKSISSPGATALRPNPEDFTLKVGDKLSISSQLNIRVESVVNNSSMTFSIWGKDNNGQCKIISNSGYLYTLDPYNTSREFVDAFLELISVNNNQATVRKYTSTMARQRCLQIAPESKRAIACSFYDGANKYMEANNNFTVRYRELAQKQNAQVLLQGFTNCFNQMKSKYVNLRFVTPFKKTWQIIAGEPNTWWSTDYERISIANDLGNGLGWSFPVNSADNGRCPSELLSVIPHELVHLLFANTVLQQTYDSKNELPDPAIGSGSFTEGMANYIAYTIGKNNSDPDTWLADITQRCGADRLLDPNGVYYPGAAPKQLLYSEILEGRGYQINHYDAGFCFFDRIEKDCGESTVNEMLGTALAWDGTLQPHSTIFSVVATQCGQQKTRQIMTDFGIDQSLMNRKILQKFPQNGFASGISGPGCM